MKKIFVPRSAKLFILSLIMFSTIMLNKTSAKSLTTLPPMPGVICGPTNPCAWIGISGATYTIKRVSGATGYTWTVPATGASILFHPGGTGVNDTIIVVSYTSDFTTGTITVSANGNSGNSAARSLTLSRLLPAVPGAITGSTNACQWIGTTGATYSIKKALNATGYNWTVPAGASIISHPGGTESNDTIITVSYTSAFEGGNITVSSRNNCVSSAVKSLVITRLLPATPGAITTTIVSTDCPNRRYSYSIPAMPANATIVLWTVPVGATIISGQGTLNITVNYPQIPINDTVRVTGVNSCTNGTAKKIKITLIACLSQHREVDSTASANETNTTQPYACNDLAITKQVESIKQALSKDGFIVIKESGISMENDTELPVLATLSSNDMYQVVFVGDMTSRTHALRMFGPDEKQIVYEKQIFSNPDGNVISYAYRARSSGYHIIQTSQVNETKKNSCGYIIVFKKTD